MSKYLMKATPNAKKEKTEVTCIAVVNDGFRMNDLVPFVKLRYGKDAYVLADRGSIIVSKSKIKSGDIQLMDADMMKRVIITQLWLEDIGTREPIDPAIINAL